MGPSNLPTQLQFNRNVPSLPDNLAIRYSGPRPIVIEKLRPPDRASAPGLLEDPYHRASIPFSFVSEEKLSLAVHLAKRDVKKKQLQELVMGQGPAKGSRSRTEPTEKPRGPFPGRQRTSQVETAGTRAKVYLTRDPGCRSPPTRDPGPQPYAPKVVPSQSVLELRRLQKEMSACLQRIEGMATKDRLEEGLDPDEAERSRVRRQEQAVRTARTLYVLQQQVKEIQEELDRLSPHRIKHTKKSRAMSRLAAAQRGAIRALQMFVNQFTDSTGQAVSERYRELGNLIRQLSICSARLDTDPSVPVVVLDLLQQIEELDSLLERKQSLRKTKKRFPGVQSQSPLSFPVALERSFSTSPVRERKRLVAKEKLPQEGRRPVVRKLLEGRCFAGWSQERYSWRASGSSQEGSPPWVWLRLWSENLMDFWELLSVTRDWEEGLWLDFCTVFLWSGELNMVRSSLAWPERPLPAKPWTCVGLVPREVGSFLRDQEEEAEAKQSGDQAGEDPEAHSPDQQKTQVPHSSLSRNIIYEHPSFALSPLRQMSGRPEEDFASDQSVAFKTGPASTKVEAVKKRLPTAAGTLRRRGAETAGKAEQGFHKAERLRPHQAQAKDHRFQRTTVSFRLKRNQPPAKDCRAPWIPPNPTSPPATPKCIAWGKGSASPKDAKREPSPQQEAVEEEGAHTDPMEHEALRLAWLDAESARRLKELADIQRLSTSTAKLADKVEKAVLERLKPLLDQVKEADAPLRDHFSVDRAAAQAPEKALPRRELPDSALGSQPEAEDNPHLWTMMQRMEEIEQYQEAVRQRFSQMVYADLGFGTTRGRSNGEGPAVDERPRPPHPIQLTKRAASREPEVNILLEKPLDEKYFDESVDMEERGEKRAPLGPVSSAAPQQPEGGILLSVPREMLRNLSDYQDSYQQYLRTISHESIGTFNPWIIVESLAEELVEEALEDVAAELQDVCEDYAEAVFTSEFLEPSK
ncbi:protein moonraker isoform X2 [Vombatus ursinus]|uniref:protein moonraker isoform X2 n=1 Tax=Vombatus ursinus TaxID=29139 RepID=UPI000FFD5733|nr:protein moonraker isoform X2 [Vombatus ursinus]